MDGILKVGCFYQQHLLKEEEKERGESVNELNQVINSGIGFFNSSECARWPACHSIVGWCWSKRIAQLIQMDFKYYFYCINPPPIKGLKGTVLLTFNCPSNRFPSLLSPSALVQLATLLHMLPPIDIYRCKITPPTLGD